MSTEYYNKLIDELMDLEVDILEQLELSLCFEQELMYRCMLEELDEMIDCIKRILVVYQ